MKRLILASIIGVLAACAPSKPQPEAVVVGTESPQRATMVAADPVLSLGKQQYDLRCAHCHGYDGSGQLAPTIENTLALGMNLVPAHDSSGHTWQHPDQLLIKVIKEGIRNPLNQFPMESYEEVMTDEEINAVLDYIRLWWTDEQREHQRGLTEHWAELDAQFSVTESD